MLRMVLEIGGSKHIILHAAKNFGRERIVSRRCVWIFKASSIIAWPSPQLNRWEDIWKIIWKSSVHKRQSITPGLNPKSLKKCFKYFISWIYTKGKIKKMIAKNCPCFSGKNGKIVYLGLHYLYQYTKNKFFLLSGIPIKLVIHERELAIQNSVRII